MYRDANFLQALAVRERCVPWLLDPSLYLHDFQGGFRACTCPLIDAYLLLAGVFVG